MKHFTPFRFDVSEGTLWRGSQHVPLTRKAGALLRCLLSSAGTWVSRATIMSAVWPDTHVQPDNVKVLVREIRQALGDHPRNARFIKSAAGRGYSFIAPVGDGVAHRSGDPEWGSGSAIFVNRGPELAALADALDAARASDRRLVLVSGERGIGKTALCDVFIRTATAASPARVCYGQSVDRVSPQEPYYPFLDALLRLDLRNPGLVPSILSQHAPSWLAQFPQWVGSTPTVVHPLTMVEELTRALEALSLEQPLVIVLEDLQWADSDTLQALARLAQSRTPAKLLVVGTYCDGDWTAGSRAKQRLTRAISDNHRCRLLDLGPLTPEQVGRYLDARFGPTCLTELSPAVHHATGGNPFMMVSAIDSLIARGFVVREDGRWLRAATLEAIAHVLPETLGQAVARQIDQLEPEEREALEAAAVIGLDFTAASVAIAMGGTVDHARRILTPLVRRTQLISACPGDGVSRAALGSYRFRHALFAEVLLQRAPMLRQLRAAQRLDRTPELTLRRA
jgi:DNA-binding winged helix-turn-helix (wHTH) protein